MTNQDKADKINALIKPFTDLTLEASLHEDSIAFVDEADGKLCVDLCFYRGDDGHAITEAILEKAKALGIALEKTGDGDGMECTMDCYTEVEA